MDKNIKAHALIFIILILFLPSCSLKTSNNTINAPIEETLSSFFYSLKKGDLNSASQYWDQSKEDYTINFKFQSSFQENIIKQTFSKVDYKIVSASCNENTAKVTLDITTLDLLKIYNDLMSKSLSPLIDKYLNGNEKDKIAAKNEIKEIISTSINNIINSDSFPKATNRVKLTLSKVNGKWLIHPKGDFIYAITGGMPQLLNEVKK